LSFEFVRLDGSSRCVACGGNSITMGLIDEPALLADYQRAILGTPAEHNVCILNQLTSFVTHTSS
jgi:hypothetical protein